LAAIDGVQSFTSLSQREGDRPQAVVGSPGGRKANPSNKFLKMHNFQFSIFNSPQSGASR